MLAPATPAECFSIMVEAARIAIEAMTPVIVLSDAYLATAASDRRGVLTWVVPSEGMAVHRGDELARIADLSAFRVEATVSDVHASRLVAGLPVTVRSGDSRLGGRLVHAPSRRRTSYRSAG